MAKRPEALETVVFALELLRRIPRGRKVSAADLQAQLHDAGYSRDLRTIQRQLSLLSEHFQIERDDRERPYGYRWLDRAQPLAIPTLTPQESLLLQLAEEHLKFLLPARLMKAMAGFFSEARRNLGSEPNARLEKDWARKIRVVAASQPLLPPKIPPSVFEAVSDALYWNKWLKLDYRNAEGRRSSVEVMPLGLAQQGPRMYLVCRYRSFTNERTLAVHRIKSAEVLPETFERPIGFDLKKYDDDGRFGLGDGRRVQLVFRVGRAAGAHLYETPLSADQSITNMPDGRLEVTATVVDSAMLDWWLRGFGPALSDIQKIPIDGM
jgi:predicted DNA-binding transcriptional regulator YafY